MKRVLREWYYGRIIPIQGLAPLSAEGKKREDAYCALLEPFEEKVRALGLQEEYKALDTARVNYDAEWEAELFSRAFCLGAQVMLEVLDPHMVF